MEWSEDAIIVKDLQGRIVEWNRSAERLFGYSREEAIGRSIEMLMPPDRADDWRKILDRMLKGERIAHFETRRRARDGRILDVSLTVSPVRDQEGRIVGASKIVRDVTAEREAPRESEKTRELFLGMLGHDLQNPLSTINVSVHTLKRHASEADQKVLARISNSTGRMSRMIDQLLDFTGAVWGVESRFIRKTPTSTAICRTVADEFEVLHPGRIRVSADGDLRGLWDSDRLTEVLSNLVSNAFKYGAPEEKVAIGASTSGEHVLVEVTNQGPEIPESLLPTDLRSLPARRDRPPSGNRGTRTRALHRPRDRVRSSGRDHRAFPRRGNDVLGEAAAPGPATAGGDGPDALSWPCTRAAR